MTLGRIRYEQPSGSYRRGHRRRIQLPFVPMRPRSSDATKLDDAAKGAKSDGKLKPASNAIEGRFVRKSKVDPEFRWQDLTFKPNGVVEINNREFVASYEYDPRTRIVKIKGGITPVGELNGNKLLILKETFVRR